MTQPRAVVLFDPSGTAHSVHALQGLADAAADRSLPVVVHAPESPAPRGDLEFVHASVGVMLTDRTSRRAHRRTLADALGAAPDGAVFCDMGLGRTVQSRGPRIPAGPSTVFIGHQTNAVDDPRDGGRRRDAAGNRRVLRRLAGAGARVIAHTDTAERRWAELIPPAAIRRAGWPVAAATDACLAPGWRPPATDTVTLLFAGSARMQKGLPLLLEAARSVTGFDRLVIPGRIAAPARAGLDLSDPRVQVWDRWLTPAEYSDTLAAASIVVLPYRSGYLVHGIYSSVMGEAMAYGRPLVVSAALGALLPEGYRGAVVAPTDSPIELEVALADAIARRDELEAAAMTEGREHVRTHHTYERYLDAILAAGA